MNLIDLYDTLKIPDGNENVFNAVTISEYPNFKIAIDFEGNPIILLTVVNSVKNITLKNFRLKYLRLQQNVECKILENGKSHFQTFTLITFTCLDRNLQEYFLRISETLIKTLNIKPTQQEIITSLNKFVEVFRSLTDKPTNTIQGLWAELFLIDNSTNPKILLDYWHNIPEEKFDFNSGEEIVEVKSNSNFERIHTFSSEQLIQTQGISILIASIFMRQSKEGRSIQQLIDSISEKVNEDFYFTEKLNRIVIKTLGDTLEQSIGIKFDYTLAKGSLQFYRQQDISKIEEFNIPYEVSEVRYKSDLRNLSPIIPNKLSNKGKLFDGM